MQNLLQEKNTSIGSEFTNSTWANRSELSIAQGALTNSKRPECLVKGVYPTHLIKGQGSYVFDTNRKKYIDFICGLGSNLLGYGHPEVTIAAIDRLYNGPSLSLGTDLEVRFAERIKGTFPFIERVKILKTGSDACSAAIRIARAYTGRDLVMSEGYHGWHDAFQITPPAKGVVDCDEYRVEKLNESLSFDRYAAIIVEPVMTDASPARREWLRALRDKCTKSGTMLIFDEVITGFRWPKYSVSNHWGISPDLICMGKAMGNGMPIAVVGGRAEVMNCGEYFVSSTFAGETASIAAAMKVMDLLHSKYNIDELWIKGEWFQRKFNEIWPDGVWIEGYPTRGVFKGSDLNKALFWQEACIAGMLFGPSFFFNFGHIEMMEMVLNLCSDILGRIKLGAVQLKGEMPSSPFAQKVRNQ